MRTTMHEEYLMKPMQTFVAMAQYTLRAVSRLIYFDYMKW